MAQRDVRGYLQDILDGAGVIRGHIRACTFDEYARSTLLQDAVERRFAIIGEALNRALQADRSLPPRIADARQIIAFRNRLIHVYSDIDPRVVWDVVHDHLPALVVDVERILHEPQPPGTSD